MSRLEELRYILIKAIQSHQSLDHKLHLMEDVDEVIEQAERVQELENEYKVRRVELLEEHIERLEKVNRSYKQALEEIGFHAIFKKPDWKQEYHELKIIARQALEEPE